MIVIIWQGQFSMDCNKSKSYICYIIFKFSNVQVSIISVPWRCCIPNLFKMGPVAIEKKMLTNDGRRTPDHDEHQPVATGHLSGLLPAITWKTITILEGIVLKSSKL